MTYIRINITINEEAIREETIKLYQKIETYIQQHYREIFIRACELGTRHSQTTIVARIHKFLNHEQSDLSGTIACDCKRRSCPGYTLSVRTFVRKIKAVQ